MRCSSRESRIAPSPRARGLPPSGSSRFTPPRHSRDAYAPAAVPFGSQRGGALCHASSPSGRRGSGRVRFATDHPYVLTASCPSRMGTTAAITGFLAARRFYLIEMHQFDDTISQRFFVRITFCGVAGEAVDLGRLRGDFPAIAAAEELPGG